MHRVTGRKIALLSLATVVSLLCVDLPRLFGRNPNRSGRQAVDEATLALWHKLTPVQSDFLKGEYDTAVAAIAQRVQDEHLLFALKLALVGGILYAAFQAIVGRGTVRLERTPFTALVAWSAVIVSAIVDLRIVANQNFVATLGAWVRTYEELRLGPAVKLGWEAFLADTSVPASLRLSGQVLTALLFGAVGVMFLAGENRDNDSTTALLSGAGGALSVALMTAAALGFRQVSFAIVYASLGVVGIVLVAKLADSSHSHSQASNLSSE
jgi:hypothetical protein